MSNVTFASTASSFVPSVDVADEMATFLELYLAGEKLEEIFGSGRKLVSGNANSLLDDEDGFLKMVEAQKKWARHYYEVEVVEEIKDIRAEVEGKASAIEEMVKAIRG